MSLQRVRSLAKEVVALGRNYRHAAIMRRYVRTRYGAVVTARPSILIGEALTALTLASWRRLAVLAALLVVALRR